MITSVYLSNDVVRIVRGERSRGSVEVRESLKEELSEGSLLNGIITNDQELFEQLQEIWEKYGLPYKNVELILNSSKIISRNVTVSRQRESQIRKILPMEFNDVEHQEAVSYDYALWNRKRGTGLQEIMAVMAEDAYLQGFIHLFARLGVELSRISVFRTGIRNFLLTIPELNDQASIVFIVDGNSLISVLWDNGSYTYMDRKRLFEVSESDQFAFEVVHNINTVMQFHSSQKSEHMIMKAYTCGFSQRDLELCREQLEQFNLNLPIDRLLHPQADAILAAGGLLVNGKDINLLRCSRAKRQVNTKLIRTVEAVKPVIAVLAVFLLISLVLLGINFFKSKELQALASYTDHPDNIEQVKEFDRLETAVSKYGLLSKGVKEAWEILSSYPLPGSRVTGQIIAQADEAMEVTVAGYDGSGGAVQVKLTVAEVTLINRYIDRLYSTELFGNIEYSGYTYQESEKRYTVNMVCYLKEKAGRPEGVLKDD